MSKHSSICLKRIQRLQESLSELDGYFIQNPVDLFYYTGMRMSCGHLYVCAKGVKLFVDGRYLAAATSEAIVPSEELKAEGEVEFLKGCHRLAFDGSVLSYAALTALRKKARRAGARLVSRPQLLKGLRMIKDPSEIQKMKKSAQLAYSAYQFIRKALKPGVSELELARKLEIYCLEQGAEGMSFEPIIAFGKNSALPHYHPGKTRLKEDDIALFDLGVVLEGYCSDMTRVDFVGRENATLKQLFDVNRAAHKMALSMCKPEVKLKELDSAARRVMRGSALEHLYLHSLGHGIGLQVHEAPGLRFDGPDRNLTLKEGMVITIEPGLYLSGQGGVRHEDTIVITRSGYENFYPESEGD